MPPRPRPVGRGRLAKASAAARSAPAAERRGKSMRPPLPCRATFALLAGLLAALPALRVHAARRPTATAVVVAPYAPLAGVPGSLAAKVTALVADELGGRESLRLAEAKAPPQKIARGAPD